jgi:8-oxo-dGTP pyrophosphatase MutT (NUDIX family)
MEPQDLTLEHTARREAHEECGITLNRHKVRKLATLSPFLSRGNLIVTPVVFFITDQTLMVRVSPHCFGPYIQIIVNRSLFFLLVIFLEFR